MWVSGGKENVSLAEALNQARLPIIDFKTCRQKKFWGDRVRDTMICAGFRDKEDPPAACQVSSIPKQSFCVQAMRFHSHVGVSGRLWRPPAVPAGAGPLGGARRGQLRSHRLHRGEQAQRFYPHRRLHPLDRGDADQRFLPALIRGLASGSGLGSVSGRPAHRHRNLHTCTNRLPMLHIYRICCAILCTNGLCNKTGSKRDICQSFGFFFCYTG